MHWLVEELNSWAWCRFRGEQLRWKIELSLAFGTRSWIVFRSAWVGVQKCLLYAISRSGMALTYHASRSGMVLTYHAHLSGGNRPEQCCQKELFIQENLSMCPACVSSLRAHGFFKNLTWSFEIPLRQSCLQFWPQSQRKRNFKSDLKISRVMQSVNELCLQSFKY